MGRLSPSEPKGLERIAGEAERAAAVALRLSEVGGAAGVDRSDAAYADGYLSGLCFALSVLRGRSPALEGGEILERVRTTSAAGLD